MPKNGGFGGDAFLWRVPNSGASKKDRNGSCRTTASPTQNNLRAPRPGGWNCFASLSPILEVPAIGKSGALERLNSLKSAIDTIEHHTFAGPLFIDQGKALTIVTEPGEVLHKLIKRHFEKLCNSFDLTVSKDDITFPLAAVSTALALIPWVILSVRHFKSNYRPSMLRRYTSTALRKPCHFAPGRPFESRKWGQFLLGGFLPRRGHL